MGFPWTHNQITLWDLAHKLCGKNPYQFRWLPIPPDVKDAFRTFLHEIHYERLDSNLIYEKKDEEDGALDEYYLRYHLQDIFECIAGRKYPRELLKFILIDKWEFQHWCEMTGYPLPDFWFSLKLNWEDNDSIYYDRYYGMVDLEELDDKKKYQNFTQREKDRIRARCIAVKLWEKDRTRPALDIAFSDEMQDAVGRYTDRTITKWIQAVMPEELRNKKGRPKKKKTTEE